MILLSAFFSSSETALTASSRIKLKVEKEDGNKASARAIGLIESYDRSLIALLVGNNIVNTLTASLTTVIFTDLFGMSGVGIATLVVTCVVIVFGEVMPKSFANESPETLLKIASPVLIALRIVFFPIIVVLMALRKLSAMMVRRDGKKSGTMTEEELRVIIEEIEDEGVIEEQQSELLQSALQFSERCAGDIITHRVDIIALPTNADKEEFKNVFLSERFSRLPVYEKSIDEIVGIVNQKDFYSALLGGEDFDVYGMMQKPIYVPPRMPLLELIRLLDREKTHIAVVVDSFGGTEGIVTLEDVLEELVGEIWDEHDEVLREIKTHENGYMTMAGDVPMTELFDLLDIKFPKNMDDVTIAAYLLDRLGFLPEVRHKFTDDNFEYTVLEITDQRIIKVGAVAIATPVKER